ncbi:uncharacterized protein LOC133516562 [Cydia pomonella]|uniref:uncharacterized protein LOC133516562 n=1 Tax=Cydia pomonella TaxID=82600 RepID=UPI002ADD4901|nr:uncharacterized protein LOC133516562 [Cydia pomonella]
MLRACVRVYCICLCASVVLSVHVAKEYVCQDPDTGTLHELNTTWRSTTFCGNYTCKIRRINTGQQPSKVFVSLFNQQSRSNNDNKINHTNEFSLSKLLPELTKDSDRLLNKAEIQKITELLHSVKKSDLQAVIELYNVAQEMYKDMKLTDTKEDNRASEAISGESRESSQHKTSYWYEPANEHRKEADMKPEGTELEGSTLYSASPYPYAQQQPYFYSQSRTNYPNYFTGSLLNNDGRVGYPSLPMNQQGMPAYYQQRIIYDAPGPTPQSPCNPCVRPYQYQPMPMPANYPPRPTSNMYPYLLRYNYTTHAYNNYYKGNPWAYYDYYRNLPYQKPSQFQRNPNTLEKIPDENSINADIKDEKSWKTDPLSEEVINEIRANIAQRGKLINIPLKKRIKLERVSKVIKLDQNNRKTRSITKIHSEEKHSRESDISQKSIEESKTLENTEVMETYVEKVMCEPTTELGYFKIGNMNKPYPDCCPQKIEDKQR